MKYINKKQKIVLIIIISIITFGISYYTYATKINEEFNTEEQNLEVEENEAKKNITEENNEITDETTKIVVHVSGAVNQEGVFELAQNSRVADAIEVAGGVTENAYMKDVNLASPLEDGMKIYIPTKEENEQGESTSYIRSSNTGTSSSNNNAITQNSGGNKTSNKNVKVNINTAGLEELDTLPGIGESTANKIINYRNENGKFKTIEEIKEVSGIGDSKYEKIKDLIEV